MVDKYGYHLSKCSLGGWRTSRHDDMNCEVDFGIREAGNNATWTDPYQLPHALPSHRKEKGSRTRRHRIPDIKSTDQNGAQSAVDCMVTTVTCKVAAERTAAKAGEDAKWKKHEQFLQKCKAEDPGDPRLRTEIIPFVVEAHGAAGPEACRLMAVTKHQFGQLVLPCEDKSSEQTFFSAWAFRISSALQRGTALMLHNIPLGNTTKSRRTKDVDIEPTADSGALGYDGSGNSDDENGQLGGDSDSEVEISDSEAEMELEESAGAEAETAAGEREPESEQKPRPNKDRKNRNNNSNIQNSAVK